MPQNGSIRITQTQFSCWTPKGCARGWDCPDRACLLDQSAVLAQILQEPDKDKEMFLLLRKLSMEDCIFVEGEVKLRSNPNLKKATGKWRWKRVREHSSSGKFVAGGVGYSRTKMVDPRLCSQFLGL